MILFEHNPLNPLTRKIVRECPFDKGVTLIPAFRMKRLALRAFGSVRNVRIRYTIFFPRKGIFKKLLPLERKLWWLPLGGQYYMEYIKY